MIFFSVVVAEKNGFEKGKKISSKIQTTHVRRMHEQVDFEKNLQKIDLNDK